jgi:uncharacterized membrane protein YtjA (UPF0391 family)
MGYCEPFAWTGSGLHRCGYGIRFGIAGTAAAIARALFFIFLTIFLVLLIAGIAVGKKIT